MAEEKNRKAALAEQSGTETFVWDKKLFETVDKFHRKTFPSNVVELIRTELTNDIGETFFDYSSVHDFSIEEGGEVRWAMLFGMFRDQFHMSYTQILRIPMYNKVLVSEVGASSMGIENLPTDDGNLMTYEQISE